MQYLVAMFLILIYHDYYYYNHGYHHQHLTFSKRLLTKCQTCFYVPGMFLRTLKYYKFLN